METFTKLFSSIVSSSIWDEDSDTRIVWVTMMAMADQRGYVGASVPYLARQSRVSVEAVRTALEKFKAPDPDSRTKDHEGRRIIDADRGWILINLPKFRGMRDVDARRDHDRERSAERRRASVVGPSVYVMRRENDGAMRIGFHENPADRRRTLESELGVNVELLGFRPATREEAIELRDRFAGQRIGKSDWLTYSRDLAAAVLGGDPDPESDPGSGLDRTEDPDPDPLHPDQPHSAQAETDPEADPKTGKLDLTGGGTGEPVAPPERTTVRRIKVRQPPEKPIELVADWRPPTEAWEHAKAQFEATDEQLARATRDVVYYWTQDKPGTRRGPRGWIRTWRNRVAAMAASGALYFERVATAAVALGAKRAAPRVQQGGYSPADLERKQREAGGQ